MEKNIRKNNGITLVALVITIIILLILAGVAINTLTQTGLFENTKQAKNATENAQNLENYTIASYTNKINAITGSVREENMNNSTNEELLDLSKYSLDGIKVRDNRVSNVQGGIKK